MSYALGTVCIFCLYRCEVCFTTHTKTGFGTGVVKKLCLFPSVTALGLSISTAGKDPLDLCVPKERLWQVS